MEHAAYLYKMYDIIDLPTYPRLRTFNYYKTFEDPFFSVTANLDVTRLVSYCKSKDLKFSQASMYCSLKAVNAIEAFHLRLVDDELRSYHTIHGGTTVLRPDKTFSFCYFDYHPSPNQFIPHMKQQIAAAISRVDFDPADSRHDLIHYSSLPWLSFTHIKHARRIPAKDSIPKLVFGKYFEQNEKYWLPFSVSVHHALVDGYHVAQYFENFQKLLRTEFENN